jgi:surface protein
MFNDDTKLKYIQCNNINNIPILIEHLPARTAEDPGFFVTNAAYTAEMNTALNAKYWNFINLNEIDNVVVQYKYDMDIHRDMLPDFNPEFTGYFWEDVIEDETQPNIVTRTIKCIDENLPTYISFGTQYAGTFSAQSESLLELLYMNTAQITSFSTLFCGCTNLRSVNTEGWDTSKVTNMQQTFASCWALRNVDVSKWDTSKVTTMQYMFYGCSILGYVDVSKWDTGIEHP